MRLFHAVYNWAAMVLYNEIWIDREITPQEAKNLINTLSGILNISIKEER